MRTLSEWQVSDELRLLLMLVESGRPRVDRIDALAESLSEAQWADLADVARTQQVVPLVFRTLEQLKFAHVPLAARDALTRDTARTPSGTLPSPVSEPPCSRRSVPWVCRLHRRRVCRWRNRSTVASSCDVSGHRFACSTRLAANRAGGSVATGVLGRRFSGRSSSASPFATTLNTLSRDQTEI